MNNNNPRNPQKSYGIIIAVLGVAMLFFYIFVLMPSLSGGTTTQEVTYSRFLEMLDEGAVTSVNVNEQGQQITFEATDANGQTASYYTGLFDDPGLVDRLRSSTTASGAPIEFDQSIPQQQNTLSNMLLSFLPMILGIVLLFVLFRSMNKRMGGDSMSFGKSNAKVYIQAQTGITFEDVAGQDEAKDALREIVDFLHNPDKYSSVGAKMPKGALLVGPPGTGKTLLAKAVAGEAGVPFFSIAGSEFVEMFVGRGAARVRDLFKQAKEKSPCIVFIDELDTIGKRRDGSGLSGNDEREQTLNQLLSEMDGFDGSSGVVILAATNRPETLDAALLRPGRFDRRIPVELPDLAGREAILKVHARKVMMDNNIDYSIIARATSGASGADLANVINESALLAVKHNRRIVTQSDLMESVETVLAGMQRKNKVINPKEKKIVAYHEIGHALVAAKQTNSAPVTKITIVPRTSGALGYTMQVDEEEQNLLSKEDAFNKIVTLTGGRSAEEVIFGTYTTGAANDIEKITKLARAMVTRYGMSEEFDMMALETQTSQYLGGDGQLACGPETAAKIDTEVLGIIKGAHQKATQIIQDNLPKMHELAEYLLEKETITGEEFMAILGKDEAAAPEAKQLPESAVAPPADAGTPAKPKRKLRAKVKPAAAEEEPLSEEGETGDDKTGAPPKGDEAAAAAASSLPAGA
ncbi:MAG: ATP-dependent zinc metalloprotease FtsH [Ruminococcaceae bacterium]|nr:ATP-dependent zinc metalloprotease FtsH [Oscillospiraceae bacterium]